MSANDKTPNAVQRRRLAVVAASLLVCLGLASVAWLHPRASAYAVEPRGENAEPGAQADFSRFVHTNPNHARLPCLLCHQRDDSPRPKLPGHVPCSGCHTQQFADQSSPICTICHTSPPSGELRQFPNLKTFGVRFDHATHTRGASRPQGDCAACHAPRRNGAALSIPAGFGAHATCFQCHTARAQGAAGQDISSCGTCHRVGGFRRTPETAPAFRVGFSHREHARRGVTCAQCHTVRAGAAPGRQVTAPAPLQHHAPAGAQSCITCHNDRRAFGGDDFSDCRRCHKGDAWRF